MEQEPGDDYLRRLATFIRINEKSLAEAGVTRRRRAQHLVSATDPVSMFNPLGWFGIGATNSAPPKPVILSVDTHHLFYVLMRLEALGIDIGTLDVQVDSPSRPMSYVNIFAEGDKAETLSLASFRSSLSAVSGLSLGAGWWGRPEPASVDTELKFIFSSFTKLPALSVTAPGRKVITELANEPPNHNALPLDAFKNLQRLECVDIDPRTLLGWDKLAESLRSMKVKRSGLEDVADIFIGAVVDDQARRQGSTSRKRCRKIPRDPSRQALFYTTRLPGTVPEDANEDTADPPESGSTSPQPAIQLSSLKWAFLKHLSLADNALTFFSTDVLPYLTSLTHLDLSSNLLVSVPPGLGTLYNLVSLNLSDNMVDTVLGIYLNLGQVLSLNLAHNRLESICGLERLLALEHVDLRGNLIEESSEVGRLAILPNISEVWVERNPFTELEEGYRIACFDYFWKEGKSITLDGTQPGFYEKRNLTVAPPEQMSSSRPVSTVHSPPIVAVGHAHSHPLPASSPALGAADSKSTPPTSANASPYISPVNAVGVTGRARRKMVKRIVDLDGDHSDGSSRSVTHVRMRSDESGRPNRIRAKPRKHRDTIPSPPPSSKKWGQTGSLEEEGPTAPEVQVPPSELATPDPGPATPEAKGKSSPPPVTMQTITNAAKPLRPPVRSRHSRYQTEFLPGSSTANFSGGVGVISPNGNGGLTVSGMPAEELSGSSSPVFPGSFRRNRGSATFSSKSALRRARVSASVYEPLTANSDGEDNRVGSGDEIRDNAEAYRRRIEALKKDMGDGWLKVFSQSQLKSPTLS